MEEEKGAISKEKLIECLDECLSNKIILENTLNMLFENIKSKDKYCKISALKTLKTAINVNNLFSFLF